MVIRAANSANQQATVRTAGNNGWSRLSALENVRTPIETEAALERTTCRAVAREAALREDGPNSVLEELNLRTADVALCRRPSTGDDSHAQRYRSHEEKVQSSVHFASTGIKQERSLRRAWKSR